MELHFNRWGNSLAVRLPAVLAKDLGVAEGVSISTKALGERVLALEERPIAVQGRKELLQRLRALHKTMPVTQPVSKDDLSRY